MIKILCGASVRKPDHIFDAHRKTLAWQVLPPDVQVDYYHIKDDAPTEDFDDNNEITHKWELSAFERVAKNKQKIFDKAVKQNYDYVWICDADLLLDHYTLWSLLSAEQQITAAVYWTRWQPRQPAMPQVWLRHPYQLDGRGMDGGEFRSALILRGLQRVWGLGACMLVSTDVLGNKKVRYSPLLPELVKVGGMMAGEDRTFCTLAERFHIKMYADAWPDIHHIYRPSDAEDIPKLLEKMEIQHKNQALRPFYGDLISLVIDPLEDVNMGKMSVRGRLGQLKLLPELEAAVKDMRRGEKRLLYLNFPPDYALPATGPELVEYRGKRKMVQVELIDFKPYDFPPVLKEDMQPVGRTEWVDSFLYTESQKEHFRSVTVGDT